MKFIISPNADYNAKDHPAVHTGAQKAGEDLNPCTPVTFKANAKGQFRLYAAVAGEYVIGVSEPRKVKAEQPCASYGIGMRFHARDEADLVPGTYGLTAVKGEVDTAATKPVFMAVSKTDLMVVALGG